MVGSEEERCDIAPFRIIGVLAHITALPAECGCGEFGDSSREFIKTIHKSGFRVWQVLPLNPSDTAPYSAISAFAINPCFISLKELVKVGLMSDQEYAYALNQMLGFKGSGKPNDTEGGQLRANLSQVRMAKMAALKKAFSGLRSLDRDEEYRKFCTTNEFWLKKYAAFVILDEKLKSEGNVFESWAEWPRECQYKDSLLESLGRDEMTFQQWVQYIAFQQWMNIRSFAHHHGVAILGDCALYVSMHSADTWANIEQFDIDPTTQRPRNVSGVPPDYFSSDGQLWGHPVFDWDVMRARDYDWWLHRFRTNLLLFDFLRIDHWRGLESFWAVPYDHAVKCHTARVGQWKVAYGEDMLRSVLRRLFPDVEIPQPGEIGAKASSDVHVSERLEGHYTHESAVRNLCHDNEGPALKRIQTKSTASAHRQSKETETFLVDEANDGSSACPFSGRLFWPPLIIEDLGVITEAVEAMTKKFGFPKMRVLQFAFGDFRSGKEASNGHLPHLHEQRSVVYPGTHDNQTLIGWLKTLSIEAAEHLSVYTGGGQRNTLTQQAKDVIRLGLLSPAMLFVVPVQDLMALGDEARFNDPAKGENPSNWTWTAKSIDLEKLFTAAEFTDLLYASGRHPALHAL